MPDRLIDSTQRDYKWVPDKPSKYDDGTNPYGVLKRMGWYGAFLGLIPWYGWHTINYCIRESNVPEEVQSDIRLLLAKRSPARKPRHFVGVAYLHVNVRGDTSVYAASIQN